MVHYRAKAGGEQ